MGKTKLLLAVKPEVPREGLRSILESEPDIELVFVCSTSTEAIESTLKYEPNVVVIDDDLIEFNGFDVLNSIHQNLPNTAIVLITHSTASSDFYNAFKAGVRGYLIKGLSIEELLDAIKIVSSGGIVIPPPITERIVEALSFLGEHKEDKQLDDNVRLGKREKAVLTLVAQGLTNSEIATILGISEHTVKQHMRNIMGRLHARTRQQAVILATEKHLLSDTTLTIPKQIRVK